MLRTQLSTRSRRILALVLVPAFLTTACADRDTNDSTDASAPEATRTVEHAMGTTEVPLDVERVVVLDTGELDATVSLGITPVGAVTTDVSTSLVSYLEDELAQTEPVGTISEPNLEAIAALEPDLILSNTVRHEDLYDEFSAIAPTVYAGDVGDTWKETLQLTGDAIGQREEADRLIADYEARAAQVGKSVTGGNPTGTQVSVVRFLPDQIRLYGEASFIGTVLADAGFARPDSQQVSDTFAEVSSEQISQADGDIIFTSVYGAPEDTAAAKVTGGELWKRLSAVQTYNAHEVSDDTWMLGIGVTAANHVLDDIETLLD